MYLGFETILDVYSHKDKKILCQIKVNPKNHKFKNCRCLSQEQWKAFDKELEKLIATIDDWSNEKCLKFIIKPYIQVKVKKSNLSLEQFYKCCGKTVDCLMGDENFADVLEANCVLECIFDFHWNVPLSSPIKSHEFEAYTEASLDDMSCSPYYLPYTPLKKRYKKNAIDNGKTSSTDHLECDENTNSSESCNGKSVVDPNFSPTKLSELAVFRESNSACQRQCHNKALDQKKNDTESPKKDDFFKNFERTESQDQCIIKATIKKKVVHTDNTENLERYKSKELFEKNTPQESSSHSDVKFLRFRSKTLDEIPANFKKTYPLNKLEEINEQKLDKTNKSSSHKSKSKKSKNYINEKRPKKSSSENKIVESVRSKASSYALHHKFESGDKCDEYLISQRRKENRSNSNVPPTSTANSTTEISPQEIIRIEIKPKASSSKNAFKSLRRSERSPTKPKRFIEEQQNATKKRSEKLRSLFGIDNNDDNYFENNSGDSKTKTTVLKTPESKKSTYSSSSSSSSAKNKKRKRNKSEECEQEKRNINKWLSKKQVSALPLKTTNKVKLQKYEKDSNSASSSLMSLELPTKEELELIRSKTKLMQKANEKVRAELDKMRTSPPKEVQILSLQNTPVDEILDTFSTYKSELDEIFENNRKRDYIKGHDGINHCFVIRLLQQNIQMKMLEKLTEVYCNSKTTTQATLFANALLPEWVIRVYMEKFNFTRQQAINQIKAQEEFQLHMEEQSDNTFLFD